MEVTKDTMIYDIVAYDSGCVDLFMEIGMHCFSCPAALFETVEEACSVHGVDVDDFLEGLNAYFAEHSPEAEENNAE